MRGGRLSLVLSVLALVAGLTACEPTAPHNEFQFGMNLDDGGTQAGPAADAGFRYVRIRILWADLEPRQGEFRWDLVDSRIAAAKARGLPIRARVFKTPSWAAGPATRACSPSNLWGYPVTVLHPPASTSYYYNVMRAISTRYRSQIASWEIWNEPDFCNFWKGTPADYKRLILEPGYRGIKDGSGGKANVIAPALAHFGTSATTSIKDSLKRWVGNGSGGLHVPLDYVSYHSYPHLYSTPYNFDIARNQMKSDDAFVEQTTSNSLKGYWITEMGVPNGVDDNGQKTKKFFDIARQHPLAKKVFYFRIQDWNTTEAQLGLIASNGTVRPRYSAISNYLHALNPPPLTPPTIPLPVCASPTAVDSLAQGQCLHIGEQLSSKDGRFVLVMQGDGNLVLYGPSGAAWWTGLAPTPSVFLFQTDGNVVLYGRHGAVWSSSTYGRGGTAFVVQNDGNLVLYGPQGAIWSRYTNG